jgi:hypothetical protein
MVSCRSTGNGYGCYEPCFGMLWIALDCFGNNRAICFVLCVLWGFFRTQSTKQKQPQPSACWAARRDRARKQVPHQPRAGFQHPPGDRGFTPTALARPGTVGGQRTHVPKTRICYFAPPAGPHFPKMATPSWRWASRKPGKIACWAAGTPLAVGVAAAGGFSGAQPLPGRFSEPCMIGPRA